MAKYSYAQLEGLWTGAGGSKAMAPLMAAIAMAESGGESDARNPSGATGLWQILGAVNVSDQSRLLDPQTNAHEALLKYNSQGLKAWTTYTSGAYKKYLRGKVPPVTTPGGLMPGGGGGSAALAGAIMGLFPGTSWGAAYKESANPLSSLAAAVTEIATAIDWLVKPSNELRIVSGIGGGVMLIFGLHELSKAGKGGQLGGAVGIALVTAGTAGLFVAFHNLPPHVQNFGQLIGYESARGQAGKEVSQ